MDTTSDTNSGESTLQTDTDRLLIRVRAVVDEWFVLVVVALLALSLLGGWGTYAAFAAEPADEEDTVEPWSTTGGFDHHAVVQEENDVFEVGTELTDRSTYFTTVTPELDGEFRYGYEATGGDVMIRIDLERIVRSVDDGTVYWSTNETLETTTVEGVEPGAEQSASFRVDVATTANETERIEDSLGASPGSVEAVVLAEVTMTGTIDGEPVERTDVYELRIDPAGDIYQVDGPTADRWTAYDEETEETAAADSASFLGPVSSAIVLVGSIGGLGALTISKRQGTLAPPRADRERLRLESEREEFDDWISRGSIPPHLKERSRVVVETLEDLVDIAIDCDRRVIEDDRTYYVVDGDVVYHYDPPTPAVEDERRAGETAVTESEDDSSQMVSRDDKDRQDSPASGESP